MRPARFILHCLSFLLIFALLLPSFSSLASAQTPSASATATQTVPSQTPYSISPYVQPNFEENVPLSMHTLIQGIFLEMMVAFGCQLSGIDLASPREPCLAPNPLTTKIGYAPIPTENGELQIGGLLGIVGKGIGAMYTPTITTSDYTSYLAGSFGLVKQSLAAPPKDAFEGFSPLLGLWTVSRNISYFLLILAFVFIGIGVMMRLQLDPRTVMTIQNQIPRIIIAIILITFSYSIAAFMADLMWASTYLMINVVTTASGNHSVLRKCDTTPGITVDKLATNSILASPFSFVNRIFIVNDCDTIQSGMLDLSRNVSNNITGLQKDVVMSIFGLDPDATCSWNQGSNTSGGSGWDWIPGVATAKSIVGFVSHPGDIGDCIFYGPFGKMMDWLISTMWQIAVFISLIITLGRIWFMLLKAYAYIFLYVILAPVFIVINLLPKKPLGFERWLRVFFVNLAIFPVTVLMLLVSRAFMDMFDQGADKIFVPPLIGNPNHNEFGALIGFATLLLIPGMYSLLREKLSLHDIKQVAIGTETFAGGRKATAWAPNKMVKYLNWHDQQGRPIGPLALTMRKIGNKFTGVDVGRKIPILSDALLRRQVMDAHHWGWDTAAQAHFEDLQLKRALVKKYGGWNWDAWEAYIGKGKDPEEKSKIYNPRYTGFGQYAAKAPPKPPPATAAPRTGATGGGTPPAAGTPPTAPRTGATGGGTPPAAGTPPATRVAGAGTPPTAPRTTVAGAGTTVT